MNKATITAHVPDYIAKDLNGDGWVKEARMVSGVARVTDKGGNVWYYYRGAEITLNESTPKGYWGRWTACQRSFSTMAEAKAAIDARLATQAARAGGDAAK